MPTDPNQPPTPPGSAPWPAAHPFEHERQWLDCLLEREVLRLRARYELSLDELRGLYISDQQVDDLLAERLSQGAETAPATQLTQRAAAWRAQFDPASPLALLGARLGLHDADLDLIFTLWAPEADLRYETLYAYLNNEIGRRYATLDLARRLLGEGGDALAGHRVRARAQALIAAGLITTPEAHEARSTLGRALTLAPAVLDFLCGLPPPPYGGADLGAGEPAGLPPRLESIPPTGTLAGTLAGAPAHAGPGELICCRGEDGPRLTDWARAVLARRGRHALHLGPEALAAEAPTPAPLLARLAGADLVLHEPATPDPDPGALERLAGTLHRLLAQGQRMLWLVPRAWQPTGPLARLPLTSLDLAAAPAAERAADWARALTAGGLCQDAAAPALAASLAARFSFGTARIGQAAAAARALAATDPDLADGTAAVERAARGLAAQSLAQVAQHATKPHTWPQLVLPASTQQLLREVAGAIGARAQVFRDWGMQKRTGRSSGLMLLFAGASGTGKTMAASVVANHVGLELFRIDLAGVVSKYIGETEKNLDRIFTVARDADALLFFDEAEALLGKRAEVKDAHDRYANIEVAYLLQKMEEHDGVVILASNLPKNLDQAFSRRMHYVVEFPRPNAALRAELWPGMFPPELPLAGDLDFEFLAEQFDLTGGDIQTIALEAAFLAANAGRPLAMGHLMHALARRQTKHGDPGAAARFRVHQDSLSQRSA